MPTIKPPLTLADLLKPKVRSPKLTTMQRVVCEPTVSVGIYKIPESDKPYSIYFAKAVVEYTVNVKPKTWRENLYCITAMLSKYPHYIYKQSCKVAGKPKTYWFQDNSVYTIVRCKSLSDRTDISISQGRTIVLTETEVANKIKM